MLKQKLQEELKQAMLAQDQLKTSVLRLLLSAISYFEIQKGGASYQATDEDIALLIQKEIKQRQDSIEQFRAGKREDLVEKEEKEVEILKQYLPPQLTEEEIRSIVKTAIANLDAKPEDFGRVMTSVMPQVKGKAQGNVVARIVQEELNRS